MKSHVLLLLVTVLSTTFCQKTTKKKKTTKSPPNLLIILTDDHGYHDVGFNGCTDIPTPNLDSIAHNGIRFTHGYVSSPLCGPSRAGILTGRYQDRFGFVGNPTVNPHNPTAGIPFEEETIAEVLKKVGYKNAAIGKWHMGSHPLQHPLNRGFDHFFGFLSGGHRYLSDELDLNDLTDVKRKNDWYRTRLLRDFDRVDMTRTYLTDELTDAAIDFLDRHAADAAEIEADESQSDDSSDDSPPFFLYLAYNAPHTPLQATEEYLSRFTDIENLDRRTYAAMISAVDDGVGRVLETLRRHDMEEDTLIVFLSDNGGASNAPSSNAPLRGHKSDLLEGGMHVPFAMQWKGKLPEGTTYTHPIISLDIMATITQLSNAPIDPDRPLDGVNLIPYLTQAEKQQYSAPPHPQLFWRVWKRNAMAVLDTTASGGKLKLVHNARYANYNSHRAKLYDLETDPGELQNLLAKKRINSDQDAAATANALLDSWDHWNSQLKDPVFVTVNKDTWWLEQQYPEDATINATTTTTTTTNQTIRYLRAITVEQP